MKVFRGITKGDLEAIQKEGVIKAVPLQARNAPLQPIICLSDNKYDAMVYANRKIHSGESCLEPKEPVVVELEVPDNVKTETAFFEDDNRKSGYVAFADLSASFIIRASPVPKMTYEEVHKELKE